MSHYNNRFEGKVAIVTGATSGIGKAVAIGLAQAGASVVVVGRRVDEGRAAVDEITASGGRASYFKADISKEEDVEKMVQFTVDTYGKVDMAFNNAGVSQPFVTTEVTEADYNNTFNVNVWGVLACMKHEIRAMLKTGGGSIVNCTSIMGKKGIAGHQVYSASKHAVEGLTKSVALEYAKRGIRVNALAPGPTITDMMAQVVPTKEAQAAFANIVPQGKVAIVTGATSGIGKAVAIGLAQAGASVVVVGRRVDEGRAAVDEITASGGRASYFKADISKEEDVEKMVQFTVDTYGKVDMAFNNAGVSQPFVTTEVTEADYNNTFNVNVWGVLACMKHEIRAMLKTGGGSIVNCTSIMGKKGIAGHQVYSASKHAVEGLTKSVALEYAKRGIRVNALAPGPTITDMMAQVVPTKEAQAAFANIVPQGISLTVDGGMLA
eukprot:gene9349-biopygen1774